MQPTHLFLLVHGLFGSSENLLQLEAELLKASKENEQKDLEMHVLLAGGIAGSLTFDGVDVQAIQVAKELDAEIEKLYEQGKDVVSFTLTGYSLGGLVARFLVGLLDARSPSFFEKVRPVGFGTFATPHIGIPKYGTRFSRVQHLIGPNLFSSSGQQLFCLDDYSGGRCLLDVMADPTSRFMKALNRFDKIQIIANGCHDLTVPFPSGAFVEFDPFVDFETSGLKLEVDENECITSWTLPDPDSKDASKINAIDTNDEEADAENAPLLHSDANDVTRSELGRERDTVKRKGKVTAKRKRSKLPPPVQVLYGLRFPLNYLALACLPILIPVFICYALTSLTFLSWKSYRRMANLLTPEERASLRLHDALSSIDIDASALENRDSLNDDDNYDEDPTGLKSIGHSGTATPVIANVVPLELSSTQVGMCRNLNKGLAKAEKIVAWFPFAYNTHGMIVLRDSKRFPNQEEARGLVRKWARGAVAAAIEAAQA